ncbi:MAG: PHP domain-containing protein, partial [Acidimicrobiales bacterium]
ALTDHDRLDGLAGAAAAARRLGVELVPGCELSCTFPGTLHLLVYFVEPGDGPLQEELVRLQRDREDRNRALFDRLGELGLPVTEEEVRAEAGHLGTGLPHVAAVLVRNGAARSIQDAFDRFLGRGQVAYVPKARLEPATAIGLAVASGGLPVLAHPLTTGRDPAGLRAVVEELVATGLVGLEAHYSRYSAGQREELARLAASVGLVATGGSDYHGSYKPGLSVGCGTGDLDVPDAALDALRARRS